MLLQPGIISSRTWLERKKAAGETFPPPRVRKKVSCSTLIHPNGRASLALQTVYVNDERHGNGGAAGRYCGHGPRVAPTGGQRHVDLVQTGDATRCESGVKNIGSRNEEAADGHGDAWVGEVARGGGR